MFVARRDRGKRLGSAIAVGAMIFASAVMTQSASASSPAPVPTMFPSQEGVSSPFPANTDPDLAPVSDVEETKLEFAPAQVSDTYTEEGPVAESQGDQQQVEAVAGAKDQADESDVDGIARIDLDADVAVVGVTWDDSVEQPVSVNWRYLKGGAWSQWGELEIDSVDGGRPGTEPLTLSNIDSVEVVARTEDGASISNLVLHVINAKQFAPAQNTLLDIYPEGPEEQVGQDPTGSEPGEVSPQSEAQSGAEPAEDVALDSGGATRVRGTSYTTTPSATVSAAAASPGLNADGTVYDTGFEGLKIGTRKAWCTGECQLKSDWTPELIKIQGAVIHHTEGNNDYTQAQVPQQLRNVWQYQAVTRGWDDIGYNIVVDKFGGVWEGRDGGLTKPIKGAHAFGANSDTFGIVILGSYTKSPPPVVARDALSKAIAWKLHILGLNSATKPIQVPGEDNQNAGNGQKITVPTVSAHRDVGNTDCPGDAFYAQMDLVRSQVAGYMAKFNAPPVTDPQFNPGNVITDRVFYNPKLMNVGQIEAFIKDVGKNCTSTGDSKCLKDATFPTSNLLPIRKPTGGCTALKLTGNQRPWTIIDSVAKACGLNPQVILTTLQKEQSGLTKPRPSSSWDKAMGAGCPDGKACDPKLGGFTGQVYYGAEMLATYKIRATWEEYILAFQEKKPVSVRNNPEAACGTETFTLQNYATASLYMYTPYVGNGGEDCSTIGQKMVWDLMKRYFPWADFGVNASVKRLSGPTRYDTAVAISKDTYPNTKGGVVYVATAMDFPDALAAAPAAAVQKAPLLLVPASGGLPAVVSSELQRLQPSKVVIVGGTGAIGEDVETAISQAVGSKASLIRKFGADRYQTAAAITDYAFASLPSAQKSVFLATGSSFPDALSASSAAGYMAVPVVLTPGEAGTLDGSAVSSLQRLKPTTVYIAGGSGAVSKAVEDQTKALGFKVVRLEGSDRYATSAAIAKMAFKIGDSAPAVSTQYWASGRDFPDALSGAAAAAVSKSPMYIVYSTCVPATVSDHAIAKQTANVKLLGGTGVLGESVASLQVCK